MLLEVEEMTLLGVMAGDAEELAAAEEEAEAVLEAGAESGIVSVAVEMIGGRESTITGRESDAAVAVVVWTAMEAPASGSRTPGRADRARHDNQLKAVNQWTGTHTQ